MSQNYTQYIFILGRSLFDFILYGSVFIYVFLFSSFISFPLFAAEIGSNKSTSSAQVLRYDNAIISEDVTWRGKVIITDSLIIAPQATVNLEPGTTVQVISSLRRGDARFVVLGRIMSLGTSENPVVFYGGKAGWGGILLLSSMKKNQFEHTRIENPKCGIEARFSSLTTSKLFITGAKIGISLFDTVYSGNGDTLSHCDIAFSGFTSEIEIRNGNISNNGRGMLLNNSSVFLSAVDLLKNTNAAVTSYTSRLKISSCTISDNAVGLEIASSEGEITLSRCLGNKNAGMHLTDSPIKITRCQIVNNLGNGLILDDYRATIWGNSIHDNGLFNVLYKGSGFYSLVQNWWGTVDLSAIFDKISDNSRDSVYGSVSIVPSLTKPLLLP